MSRQLLHGPLVALLIASGAALVLAVEPEAEGWPAEDVKSAARRILREPEYRHFNHFPDDVKAIPVHSPTVAGDADRGAEGAAENKPAPWWKQAQGKPQPGKERPNGEQRPADGPAGQGPNGPAQQAPGSGQPGEPTNNGNQANNGNPANQGEAAHKTEAGNEGVTRPTRLPNAAPSVRGSDGIERPVRQPLNKARAPKPNAPSDSDSSYRVPDVGLGSVFGAAFHGIAYLLLAAIIGLILYLIVMAVMSAWGERQPATATTGTLVAGPLADDRSPGETAADEYLRAALNLAQQGQYHAAVGQLLLGGMSFIERHQWIRYRRGLTNRDYLRALRARPEQADGFRAVVQAFEPLEYGRRPATEDHFQRALSGYRRGFTPALDEQETPT